MCVYAIMLQVLSFLSVPLTVSIDFISHMPVWKM